MSATATNNEEIAWLAGVSTNYYERLEQARAPRPSTQVLAALGAALKLAELQWQPLARLADPYPPADETPVPDWVRALLERLAPCGPSARCTPRHPRLNDQAAALITGHRQLSGTIRDAPTGTHLDETGPLLPHKASAFGLLVAVRLLRTDALFVGTAHLPCACEDRLRPL